MLTIDSPNYVDICLTVTCDETKKSMLCLVKLVTEEESAINIKAMIDYSADGDFINQKYTTIMGMEKQALDKPIKVQNTNRTLNDAGTVTHYVMVSLKISNWK